MKRSGIVPVGMQFVWWGIWRKASWVPFIHFTRFQDSGYSLIYRWSLCIGPFEVRRWLTPNATHDGRPGETL